MTDEPSQNMFNDCIVRHVAEAVRVGEGKSRTRRLGDAHMKVKKWLNEQG